MKYNEAGKGDTMRPTDMEQFEKNFDLIFRSKINNQKLSNDDMYINKKWDQMKPVGKEVLPEYELNKSTGEVQVKDAE